MCTTHGSARWLATLVLVAAACGDGTAGPDGTAFDVEGWRDTFQAVPSALRANADLADDVAHVAAVVDTITPAPAGSPPSMVPDELRGLTFEWDEVDARYVTTIRAGAPVEGVRFVLYDRNVAPPRETGILDLGDSSDPTSARVDARLDKDGITRLDYRIEVTEEQRFETTRIAGFVTDGGELVAFDAVETVTTTDGGFRLDFDYGFELADRPLAVDLSYSLTLNLVTPEAGYSIRFIDGADVLVLSLTQATDNTFDGEVTHDGDVVMTVSNGSAGGVRFLGPNGEALTASEAGAIHELFDIADQGFGLLLPYLVLFDGSQG